MSKYKLTLELELEHIKTTITEEFTSQDEDLPMRDFALSIYKIFQSTGYSEKNILKELCEVFGDMEGLPENINWDENYRKNKNV